jgi:hypothetical protein
MSPPPAGGIPGGSAGGDLGGTFPGPTVEGIGGIPIGDTPADDEILVYDLGTNTLNWEAPAASGLTSITDGVTSVSPVTDATVPLGGVADLGGGNADLRFLTNRYGGQAIVVTEPAAGSTYDVDCSQGNVFDLTLTANLTYTISNPPDPGVAATIYLIFRQGGAGSFTVTHAAEVTWQDTDGTTGGAAPTLHTAVTALNVIELASVDGGVSWGGADVAGGSGDPALGGDLSGTASAAVVEAVQGVVVTDTGTTGTVLTKTGALTATWQTPASPTTHWEPVQFDDGSAEWPFVYFNGELVMAEVPN